MMFCLCQEQETSGLWRFISDSLSKTSDTEAQVELEFKV